MPAGNAAGKGHSRRFVLKCLAGASAALAAFPFAPQAEASPSGRPLIVFFSRTGRTRRLAAMIRERVGGDMVELKTVKPYPQDYDATVSQAKKEQQAGARPALATELPPLEGCGTVFLGYPNWWGTMPMALFTLLEKHRFSGKTIVPFCTHGGSRLGRSVEDIKRLCPEASVLRGFAAFGSRVEEAGDQLDAWLHSLNMAQAREQTREQASMHSKESAMSEAVQG